MTWDDARDDILAGFSWVRDAAWDAYSWANKHEYYGTWPWVFNAIPQPLRIMFKNKAFDLYEKWRNVRAAVREVLDVIGELRGVENLDEAIEAIWEDWPKFKDHPIEYVLDRIRRRWEDNWDDIEKLINKGLDAKCPIGTEWYWIRQNPVHWVIGAISANFPGFYDFGSDPVDYVRGMIVDAFADFQMLLDDLAAVRDEAIRGAMAEVKGWVTSRMLHILQDVIERTWEGGEAE